ncbi:MAG: hypothetical protein BRD50_09650 [Bacteroidetes bacterium SW_11_45_7]|nr:MAG: hypothetical protein BRD50_09650 [Bacteroidetes bacterium SW_11_45_7]
MTASNNLHELIQSLTPAEKRYVKIYASLNAREQENKYLHIFDIINKQEVYDEDKLMAQIEDEKLKKYLSVAKNYLQNIILRSLVEFHANNDREISLLLSLCQLKVLLKKQLYNVGEKLMQKHFKLLRNCAFPLLYFFSLDFKRRVLSCRPKKNANLLQNVTFELRSMYNTLGDLVRFYELYTHDMILLNSNQSLSKAQFEEEEKNFQEACQRWPNLPETEYGRSYYYHLQGMYYYNRFQLSDITYYDWLALSQFRNNQQLGKEDPGMYIQIVTRYLENLIVAEDFQKAADHLYLLNKIPVASPVQKSKLFLRYYMLQLEIYASLKDYKQADFAICHFLHHQAKHKKHFDYDEMVTFYLNAAMFYYGFQNNYSSALDMLNRIYAAEKWISRTDLPAFIRMLELIIHYDLGHDKIVESRLRSFERYIKITKGQFKLEALAIRYFRKLLKADQKREKELFQELLTSMQNLKKPYHMISFSELWEWITYKKLQTQEQKDTKQAS